MNQTVNRIKIEQLLDDQMINLSCVAKLLAQLNTGDMAIEISGDALRAVEIALGNAILELQKEIIIIDHTYSLTDIDYKHDNSEEKPYLCKGCGKAYSVIDYQMLEDVWGDNPCSSCGEDEYTLTAKVK